MVSETTKPAKLSKADVNNGDEVRMCIRWHGDMHDGYYHDQLHRCVVEGTVIDAPDADDDWTRDRLADGERLMVDFAIETDDGEIFRYEVDNGYVIGYHPDIDRRTDVGRFGGFYEK